MTEHKITNFSKKEVGNVKIETKGYCCYVFYKGQELKNVMRVEITPQNIQVTQQFHKTTLLEQVKYSTDMIKFWFKRLSELVGGNDEREY